MHRPEDVRVEPSRRLSDRYSHEWIDAFAVAGAPTNARRSACLLHAWHVLPDAI
jgi:hypothetical protein